MILCDFESADVAQLLEARVSAVGRYVGPWSKCIGAAEFTSYMTNAIAVWLVFEQGTSNYQGGFDQGVTDARTALGNVPNAVYGIARPIFFAVDTLVNPAAVTAYFQGICSVISPAMVGVYGQGTLLQQLRAQGLASWFWLSESTSYPGWDPSWPYLHIWQSTGNPPVPNTDLDNVGLAGTKDFGQYPAPNIPPLPKEFDDVSTSCLQDKNGTIRVFGVGRDGTPQEGHLMHAYLEAPGEPAGKWGWDDATTNALNPGFTLAS